MAKNNVTVVGKNGLADELCELARSSKLAASLQPDPGRVDGAASLVIETSAGDEEEKKGIVRALDGRLPKSSVLLTSCLRFSTTRIASWTARPERVVGFATFYPIKGRKVIELGSGLTTAGESLAEAEGFFRALGKETVWVKDNPGLTFPRILCLIINEAVRSLDEGVARAEEIDTAMRLGTNYPLGPLRWADQIGLDEVLAVLEGLQREMGEDRYRPAPLLRRMVLAGRLGERSGRGFYEYE